MTAKKQPAKKAATKAPAKAATKAPAKAPAKKAPAPPKTESPAGKIVYPKRGGEKLKEEFPLLMSVDEINNDKPTPEPIKKEIEVEKPLEKALTNTNEKKMTIKEALAASTKVIEDFIKLYNWSDRRHPAFRQIVINNELLNG